MIKSSRRQFVAHGAAALGLAATHSTRAVSNGSVEPWSAERLIEPTRALLGAIRSPVLDPFLAAWPVTAERRPVVPSAIPVLRLLPGIQAAAPPFSHELVNDISRAAPAMAWRQTYSVDDVGAAFLQNYGWSEIVGTSGPLPGEHLACGFLILGPGTNYPLHQHEAEEIYVPLSGTASWLQGDGPWQQVAPGTVIHHASHEPHAMRTGKQSMLGLYLWRSADLRQKAHFVR